MVNGDHKEENAKENGVISSELAYWAKDIASELDITTSTLRRWSIELEKAGYQFYRDAHNRRAYFERDIRPFKKLKEFLGNKMSFVDAINAVVSMFPQDKNGSWTLPVHEEKSDELRLSKRDLEELIETAVTKAVEKEREVMIQMFETKMNDVVEKRDRQVVAAIREVKETQKLIAATEEEKSQKTFWQRLFNK